MSRILVTGGSGFVGRPLAARLVAAGHDVHVVSRRGDGPSGATGHAVDLLLPGEADALLRTVRPTHLVHLAWYTVPGRFWQATDENRAWVEASRRLVAAFVAAGGERIVAAGTAAEMQPSSSPYGDAKSTVRSLLVSTAESTGIGTAWARLFQPYGPGEHPDRLVPSVIRRLRDGKAIETTAGTHRRDFVYIDDVASAIAVLTLGDLSGTVDIGTGIATPIRDVVTGLAQRLGGMDLIRLGARPLPAHEPEQLVADPSRLSSIGWQPAWCLDDGLDQSVRWWRER